MRLKRLTFSVEENSVGFFISLWNLRSNLIHAFVVVKVLVRFFVQNLKRFYACSQTNRSCYLINTYFISKEYFTFNRRKYPTFLNNVFLFVYCDLSSFSKTFKSEVLSSIVVVLNHKLHPWEFFSIYLSLSCYCLSVMSSFTHFFSIEIWIWSEGCVKCRSNVTQISRGTFSN